MANDAVRVLLVEDDGEDALLVREWLAESTTGTFTLEWVQTYDAALAAIQCRRHDVCLIDYRLGRQSGLDLLRAMTQQKCTLPVIMLTGLENPTLDKESMQAGAVDYLPKRQLSAELLERSIEHALERKRVEHALEQARDELEQRVQERTADLIQANAALHAEIAERRRMEAQLRAQERLSAIGSMVSRLTHEIANPLNGMATTVQLMQRCLAQQSLVASAELQEYVVDLEHELKRLQSLLTDLRQVSRPPQLTLQPTDLAAEVAAVIRMHVAPLAGPGISVVQDLPPALPHISADRDKLQQVVLNLGKNAIDAMPQGGTLTVRAAYITTHVLLEIEDTGEGIPEGVEIFTPFATTKTDGTGLGLVIVKQIVEAHNGQIAYSSLPGRGTTFRVSWPVAPTKESVARMPH
jgi:signal transduction histidine kinase